MWITFYRMSLNWDGKHPSKPIPLCGSDGVTGIDGRWNNASIHAHARKMAKSLNDDLKKGIIGYSIISSLRDEPPIKPRYLIENGA